MAFRASEAGFRTWLLASTEQSGGRQKIQGPYLERRLLVVRYRSLGLCRAPISGPHPHAQFSFGEYVACVHVLRKALQYLHLDLGLVLLHESDVLIDR